MSLATTQAASGVSGNLDGSVLGTNPQKYTAIDDFLTGAGAYNRPDVRDMLVKTYGDQGITGFLKLTGAVKSAGTADQVEYFEEKRRHEVLTVATGGGGTASGGAVNNIDFGHSAQKLNVYDVLLEKATGERWIVDDVETDFEYGLTCITTPASTATIGNAAEFVLIGNMYPQGSNQPSAFSTPDIVRRKNPFMIVKEKFEASGSQATNVGYINVGNGDYRWFMYGEQEARQRFLDKREMMMLFAAQDDDILGDGTGLAGSEGYFSAVEARGNVFTGSFTDMIDIDTIILELDKQGAPNEYAMYLNRQFSLDIDDLLAQGIATQTTAGLAGQFGAFNNDPNAAVALGFKSFTRGGYTFHKHDWKLLNDPTLLSGTEYKGAMVPMSQVADPRTGVKSPALEMNYKSANGYDRELNHWVTGGDVLGYTNNGIDGKDVVTFNYRSECNLVTRAANQHVILKG